MTALLGNNNKPEGDDGSGMWKSFLTYFFGSPFLCPACGRPVEQAPLLCPICLRDFPFNRNPQSDPLYLGESEEPLLTWVQRAAHQEDYRLAEALGHLLGMFAAGRGSCRRREVVVYAPQRRTSFDFHRALAEEVARCLGLPVFSIIEGTAHLMERRVLYVDVWSEAGFLPPVPGLRLSLVGPSRSKV
ncbi:MAG TPA: hypothetical protein GXX57_03250 [Firmicutes bacterium]|nr:hypothetical protein [Bacillota bacterium]